MTRSSALGALLPLLAAALVLAGSSSGYVTKLTTLLLAGALVLWTGRRPGLAIAAMLVLVVFQQVLLAFALQRGVPLTLVRAAGGLKEVVALGLLLRVLTERRSAPKRKLDLPDVFGTLLLLVIAVYYVVPLAGVTTLGVLDSSSRLLGARQSGLFVVVFLACRRLALPERSRLALQRVVLSLGAALAAGAVVEVTSSSTWDHLVLNVANVPLYRFLVYGIVSNGGSLTDRASIGGVEVVRAGSFLLSELALGFWLVVAFAMALGTSSQSRQRWGRFALAAACVAGVLLTETRAAILACLLAGLFLSFARAVRPSVRRRLRVSMVVIVLLTVPLAASTTLSTRLSAEGGHGADTQKHVAALKDGVTFLLAHPLGTGLGSGAGIGQRVGAVNTVTAENTYLGFGNELGVAGFLAFTGLFLGTVRKLVLRARRLGDPLATSMAAAGFGLAAGGMFLHVFVDIPTALVFWTMAGLALPAATRGPSDVQGEGSLDLRTERVAGAVR